MKSILKIINNRTFVIILLCLSGAFLTGVLVKSGRTSLLFVVGIAAVGSMAIIYDIKNVIAKGNASFIMPLAIATPIVYWVIHGSAMRLANLAGWFLFLIYYLFSSPQKKRDFWVRTKQLGWLFILFLSSLIFSNAFNGTLPQESLLNLLAQSSGYQLFPWLAAAGYYMLTCLYCSSRLEIERLIKIMVVVAAIQPLFILLTSTGIFNNLPILSALQQTNPLIFNNSQTAFHSSMGSLSDTELLAEYMGCMLVFAITWFLVARRQFTKLVLFFLIFSFGMAGVLSGMRSFWVISALAIILIMLLSPKNRKFGRTLFNIILVVALAIVLIYIFTPDQVFEWFSLRLDQTRNELISGNYLNRTKIYEWGLSLARYMPVYGFGGRMSEEFHNYVLTQSGGFNIWSPHSIYLWSLLTSGFAGLTINIEIFLVSLFSAYRVWAYERKAQTRFAFYSMAVFVVAILIPIHEIKIDFARVAVMMQFYFVFYGLISSWYGLVKKPGKSFNNRPSCD
jgi:hypothetical protein